MGALTVDTVVREDATSKDKKAVDMHEDATSKDKKAMDMREDSTSKAETAVDMGVHEAFMQAAATSALAGVRLKHGGPFGASIVRDGVIISCAHNMVLHKCDPCCHAEMNAISQACRALGTHDLSDCDLYTTCEPCPMCWGAVQWSRLNKAYLGVDRHTAAKYGFDDKVFYDEIDDHAGGTYGVMKVMAPDGTAVDNGMDHRLVEEVAREEAPTSPTVGSRRKPTVVLQRHATPTLKGETGERKAMVLVYDGILLQGCLELFSDPKINKTYKRRFGGAMGSKVRDAHGQVFGEPTEGNGASRQARAPPATGGMEVHERFMQRAIQVARLGVRDGLNKEREPFGAVIVKNGEIVSEACNTTLLDRDATATAEVNAIRQATQRLGNHSLEGCHIYTTAHPDLMSLGAILWSRISKVYCGVSQQVAAQFGFEEGLMHLSDLLDATSGKRVTETIEHVAKDECEAVFREWHSRNGTIY